LLDSRPLLFLRCVEGLGALSSGDVDVALSVDGEAVRARIQSARQMLTTFVPPLTVVPVSLLLPSMRELRLLQRMLSDWPVVTLSRVTSPRALSSTLPALTIWAPVACDVAARVHRQAAARVAHVQAGHAVDDRALLLDAAAPGGCTARCITGGGDDVDVATRDGGQAVLGIDHAADVVEVGACDQGHVLAGDAPPRLLMLSAVSATVVRPAMVPPWLFRSPLRFMFTLLPESKALPSMSPGFTRTYTWGTGTFCVLPFGRSLYGTCYRHNTELFLSTALPLTRQPHNKCCDYSHAKHKPSQANQFSRTYREIEYTVDRPANHGKTKKNQY
jgi:hypothetical protein